MIESADADSKFATINGLRMHYKRSGHGPAMLLLHGSTSSLEHFEQSVPLLADRFELIRPDLAGFGRTGPHPRRNYQVRTYADTVAGFLDELNVARCVVVGNSLGGNIAWNLALDHRPRVRALVLVNATGYPDKSLPSGMRLARNPLVGRALRARMPRPMVARSLHQAVGPDSTIVNEAMVTRVHQLWNRPGNRSAFVDFVSTDQVDRSVEIPDIGVPTLVLRSARIDGQHFARDIAGSREAIHPSSGHLLPEEQPAWFAAQVGAFLADLDDPEQR